MKRSSATIRFWAAMSLLPFTAWPATRVVVNVDFGAYEFQTPGLVWAPTPAPVANWAALACSADGHRVVAAVKGGPIYTSFDSGSTWTLTSAPITNWSAVASSANGSNLVATVAAFNNNSFESGGPIYRSADAGATWIQTTAPITNWSSVTSSADGSQLVAVSGGYVVYVTSAPSGPTYRSTDFGATWIPTTLSDANCTSVASSADGNKIVAASYLQPIYFSTDSGANWRDAMPTFAYLVSIASSANGETLLAGTFDPFHPPGSGGNFTAVLSTNSGATWDYVGYGGLGRGLVAISADGLGLIAAGARNGYRVGGGIIVSTNAGASWDGHGAPAAAWSAVAASADGCRFFAATDDAGIWSLQLPAAPRLHIAPVNTNVVVSWTVPSADFALEHTLDLTQTNWNSLFVPISLNLTNLKQEAVFAPQSARQFFRLRNP